MIKSGIRIGSRHVGPGSRAFVVAEIGINHGGDVSMAHKLIDAAADAGADAVKFQTFKTERLMIPVRNRLAQQEEGDESTFEMFQRMELSWQAHEQLKKHADSRGIFFMSTPFDEESADFLDRLGVPAFKVASSDITHLPLLKHIAARKKPILLSTGMSYLDEVTEAVETIRSAGNSEVLLLHCTSCYPARPEQLNLRAIETLIEHFGLPAGYSDHSQGYLVALMAVAIGASLLEKHFTLDRQASGPDHKLSTDPAGMRSLIAILRELEVSLGDGQKRPSPAEEENRRLSRRSIVALVGIPSNDAIRPWMISFKRPGGGIEPKHFEKVLRMCARRNIRKDEVLKWEDLAPTLHPDPRQIPAPSECNPVSSAERPETI